MEMESEDVPYEEDLLPVEGDYLNDENDQDLTGVDVDKLLADEDDDHSMGASVDEVIEENDENAVAADAVDTEKSREGSETMEDESTESNHVCNTFYINVVLISHLPVQFISFVFHRTPDFSRITT